MRERLFTPEASRFHSPFFTKTHRGAADLNASDPYLYMVFIFSFLQTILSLTNRPKILQFIQVGLSNQNSNMGGHRFDLKYLLQKRK